MPFFLDALCAGESDPVRLAGRVHSSVHATQEQIVSALTAEVRELLVLIDAQDRAIQHLELEIERHLYPDPTYWEEVASFSFARPSNAQITCGSSIKIALLSGISLIA